MNDWIDGWINTMPCIKNSTCEVFDTPSNKLKFKACEIMVNSKSMFI